MSLGIPEIIIIAVIIVVLFGVAKVVGDKRYMRRSGRSSEPTQNKSNNKPA